MSMKKNTKQPKIRFKGFSGDWEQRRLGEIASFSKGYGYSKQDLVENGKPIILYGRMYTNYKFIIDRVNTFALEKENSVFSSGNEVIIPASGETAEDIARASAVTIAGVLLGGDLNIVYPNENIDTAFLALNLSNGECRNNLSKRAQGKSVVHLHNSDLKEVNINYSYKDEQVRISKLFKNIDQLISLHQRKLKLYQNHRICLVNNLFCNIVANLSEWEEWPNGVYERSGF